MSARTRISRQLKATPPRPGNRSLQFETLEQRQVLSVGTFVPPLAEITPTNPVQTVRVVVLNFEPTVPSQDNRTLWDIFNWNDPRDLAAGFVDDVETASGGAIDFEIVEWRDLNEFPIFEDDFRYTADEYVANRISNSGWHEGIADFYAIAEQQGLAELVNSNQIDEIWMFGDHFFSLLGETWMAGPESFYINGPSFPDFAVDHAVAGFGFSYERGVAEMIHNLGHRTEDHIKRAHGGWDIANPVTPWDYFTANVVQSNTSTYGVGSVHYPFNGASAYDYGNTRTFDSYADDFITNFPNQTYVATPATREVWGDANAGDWQRGYLDWFFGHVPRKDSTAPDGRQNNWYKYIYDFNSYLPNSGLPRDDEAILGAAPLSEAGSANYEFTLRYYDKDAINSTTLDGADVLVTGPNGFSQLASLVESGSEEPTTAGTARTVRYRINAPGGNWNAFNSGDYSVYLQPNQVRDTTGAFLPAAFLGNFQINIADGDPLDINAMMASGLATVDATAWDIGGPTAIFDDSLTSLYRTPNIDPAVITLSFTAPLSLTGFRTLFRPEASTDYNWKVEAADTLADLNSQTGSYGELVSWRAAGDFSFGVEMLPTTTSVMHVRLTAERLTGDDYVHIYSWQLLTEIAVDSSSPSATLELSVETPSNPSSHSFELQYSDDVAIDQTSINYGDVLVTGPNGFSQIAAFYGLDANFNGPMRNATYFFSAPGGDWDSGDNGVYAIHLIGNQVSDTSGKAVPAGLLGTIMVDIPTLERVPLVDMTENNAASWEAWAQSATAITSDDLTKKVLGQTSVRFDTDGGFDTYLRYAPSQGVMWDLTDATEFHFSIYAENPSPFDFQQEPIVLFTDHLGNVRELRYWLSGSPYVLWDMAVDAWLDVTIPIKSLTQPSSGWRAVNPGAFDWSQVRSVEIHADTWDSGFTLWIDRAGFDLPLLGDFDQDNDVDGQDFLAWQRNLNVGSLSDWENNYGTNLQASTSETIATSTNPGTQLSTVTADADIANVFGIKFLAGLSPQTRFSDDTAQALQQNESQLSASSTGEAILPLGLDGPLTSTNELDDMRTYFRNTLVRANSNLAETRRITDDAVDSVFSRLLMDLL